VVSVNTNREHLEKLLHIVNIIEKYEYYMLRRAIGGLYIGIISIVATCIFIYFSVVSIYGLNPLIILAIIVLAASMIIAYGITAFRFRVIVTRVPRNPKYSYLWIVVFVCFGLLYVVRYAVGVYLPDTVFPVSLAVFLGIGNIGSYFISKRSRKYPGIIMNEYLALGILFVLTGTIISFIPDVDIQWLVDVFVLWIGMILFGMYVSYTAHKVFREG